MACMAAGATIVCGRVRRRTACFGYKGARDQIKRAVRGVFGVVVRTRRPRTTPWRSMSRITRATAQRGAAMRSRRNCFQTLRTP